MSKVRGWAAFVAIAAGGLSLALLVALHALSPEFDPSWRMVSEYANGHYGWVLSLFFAAWAVSSWALVAALFDESRSTRFRAGLAVLAISGLGEGLAAVFDINHDVGHSIAGALGILGLPIAASLLVGSLARLAPWARYRRRLYGFAAANWVSLALLGLTFALLVFTFSVLPGGPPSTPPKVLPAGVIGLVGYANRLLVVAYLGWLIAVAYGVIQLRRTPAA